MTYVEGIQRVEVWSPTPLLRFERRVLHTWEQFQVPPMHDVLQQLWQTDTGLEEWRDVPVAEELKAEKS